MSDLTLFDVEPDPPLTFVTVCPWCGAAVCADAVEDAPSWQEPVHWSYLAQLDHDSTAHPEVGRRARSAAVSGMQRTATRMSDLGLKDPAALADLRTSMNDWRTALCIANGIALDDIQPASGHDMRKRVLDFGKAAS